MRMNSPDGSKRGPLSTLVRRALLTLALLTLALIGAVPAAAALAQDHRDPVVADRTFMAVMIDKQGEAQFDITTTIPMVPDRNCFQWAVQVVGAQGAITVEEVLELPAAAGRWGTDISSLSADGTSAKTTRSLTPDGNGWIGGQWCFAPNDPLGPHRITVSAGNWLNEVFDFEVVAP